MHIKVDNDYYNTSKKNERENLLLLINKFKKTKNTDKLKFIQTQIENVSWIIAEDLELYKKIIELTNFEIVSFKTQYVNYSDEELLERHYTFLNGKFYILPKSEDPDDYVYALIDKLLYESMRHDFQEEPCKSLRAAIQKFIPKSQTYYLSDFEKILSEKETSAKTYYSECLSDNSDSEEEKTFTKIPKSHQNAKIAEAAIYRKASQYGKFFNAFKKHTTISDSDVQYRPIIQRSTSFNRRQTKSDLTKINERLKQKKPITEDFLNSLETGFLVAQYRGIHYVTTRWDAEARRQHRDLDELGKAQYSSAVFKTAAVEGYNDMLKKAHKDPDFDKKLTQAAIVIENLLIKMQQSDPCSFQGYAYQNLFLLLQKQYSADYDGFPGWLNTELKKKDSVLQTFLISEERPLLSTSDVPNHALKYAFGVKLYKGHKDERLRPRWRSDLRPERPYSGKVYLSLHPLTDYEQHKPSHLTSLFNKGLVNLPNVIVAERETSFLAYIPTDRVAYHFKAKYPSFRGDYKKIFGYKYGITESMYLILQTAFKDFAPHTVERKNIIKSLGDYLSAFNEVRLVDKAQQLAKKQGKILIYRDNDGYFSLDLPPTPTTANKQMNSLIIAERAIYEAIAAERRNTTLQTISIANFNEEEKKFRYVQTHFTELLKDGYSLSDFASIPLEKLELINHDSLLDRIVNKTIRLSDLTDLNIEKLRLICQDEVISAIDENEDNLRTILAFSPNKIALFANEELLELLENNYISIHEINRYKTKDLQLLFEFNNLERPFEEGYSLKNLLDLLHEDRLHLICLTTNSLEDVLLEHAPNVPDLVLEYAKDREVDFDYVTQSLSPTERILFKQCLDAKFDEDEEEQGYYSDLASSF